MATGDQRNNNYYLHRDYNHTITGTETVTSAVTTTKTTATHATTTATTSTSSIQATTEATRHNEKPTTLA